MSRQVLWTSLACVLIAVLFSTTDARRPWRANSLNNQNEQQQQAQQAAAAELDSFEQHLDTSQRIAHHEASNTPQALIETIETAPAYNQTELATRCPADCSGNGFCVGTTCQCKDGHGGVDCSIRVCVNNCTGNGVCVDGRCVCTPGWFGLLCDTVGCAFNCYNQGVCSSGTCVCFEGYNGIYCENVIGCKHNCSSNGICRNHHCLCFEGFSGKSCENRLCKHNCLNRGSCDPKTGKCTCGAKFHGDDCSMYFCPNDCSGNGKCNVTTGVCTCNKGFHGADCSPLNCYLDCSGRGKCVPGGGNFSKTAHCVCGRGWTGDGCEREICPDNCGEKARRGVCTKQGCKCNATWTGLSCNEPRCPYDCTAPDHGLCDSSTMQCNCLHGWSGPDCNRRTCPSMCSYRGACNNGTCICRDFWSGAECDVPVCKSNCSDHGECILPDLSDLQGDSSDSSATPKAKKITRARCACDSGWGGADCSKKLCPRDCMGRGVCSKGVCYCDKGFYGVDCSVKETVDAGYKTVTPEIAARMLCDNYCNHGKCFPVAPKANATIFKLNKPNDLTEVARNATVHYECFCEPKWAGPACNQSLIKCPASCIDKKGVCRKDCAYLNKNPCPFFNGRMCGGATRGRCNPVTGECACKDPFHGPDCGSAACPNNCSGHGMCNPKTMKCLCYGGWTGDSCNAQAPDF